MNATPKGPLCAPAAAVLGDLAPAAAMDWAARLAQPVAGMAGGERRARLALRIALLALADRAPALLPAAAQAATPATPPPPDLQPGPHPVPRRRHRRGAKPATGIGLADGPQP